MKYKVGDNVKVIAGDQKGSSGKIVKIFKSKNKALVEGINMVKKHNKPNANNPRSGPYVYDATVSKLSITLLLKTYLNIIMVIINNKLIIKCTIFLVFLFCFSSLPISKKSTQNEVVREVSALSALLYAAAISPKINTIPKNSPNPDLKAISGNNKSVLGELSSKGMSTPF